MKITIAVVDGLGGGLGAQLVAGVRQTLGKDAAVLALGANAAATERMIKAGADRGASGENALRVSIGLADYILGPIGIIVPNSLLGEITPAMAQAVMEARGERILVPVAHQHFFLAGVETRPVGALVEDAVSRLAERARSEKSLAEEGPPG